MKTEATFSISLLITAIMGVCSLPSIIFSQDRNAAQSMFSGNFVKVSASHNLKQSIYTLDTLADQMVFRYGLGLRAKRDCEHCVALHNYMKRHAEVTNALVKACRANDLVDFKKAVSDAHRSVETLQKLAKKAEVGDSVSKMISRSDPIIHWVKSNTDQFNTSPLIDPGKLFKKLTSGGQTSA